MGKTVKLYVQGVEKKYIKLHYIKTHPSPDPDTFDIIMDADSAAGIVSWNTVEIQKDGVTDFYGFIEEISPDEDSETGEDVVLTGRCWKVVVWKKYNERYQESREVGPENEDGSLETGFFGSVNPTELIKFVLRCPISVHPKDKIRHKIGWGIPSDNWTCLANATAEARYPDWVGLRTTGLAWRGRGTVDTFYTDVLPVDGFDGTYPVNTDYRVYIPDEWYGIGVSPYIDIDDEDTGMLYVLPIRYGLVGDFSFTDLDPSRLILYESKLCIKYQNTWEIEVYLYDGTDWHTLEPIKDYQPRYTTKVYNVSAILDTIAKVNAAKVRFERTTSYGMAKITYAYLECTTGTVVATDTQQQDDYFIIDFGIEYDSVTAILLECRNNELCYPKNYKIQYTLMSNCSDETWLPLESEWLDFDDNGSPINVSNNTYRDIIHSWRPTNNVRGIRIKLTGDGDYPWEISQAYIWQADNPYYTLLSNT